MNPWTNIWSDASGAPPMKWFPFAIADLARIVDLDRSTLGRNLKVLERLGYVQLAGGQDERSKIVGLTGKGKTKFEKALPLWAKAQRSMQSRLGDERAAVFRILSK